MILNSDFPPLQNVGCNGQLSSSLLDDALKTVIGALGNMMYLGETATRCVVDAPVSVFSGGKAVIRQPPSEGGHVTGPTIAALSQLQYSTKILERKKKEWWEESGLREKF
ncbi:hypothetical protein AVEN_177769-1 [Araneus ventricosus]|uniref:Uncharacterized protein n=1 Tax=Araneus ventricosus TaxID=182803 RepID=A0A4Y2LI72_ARAVE|nr:hypothetical protein AVEN_177769-1 [Araneus ventricosus]